MSKAEIMNKLTRTAGKVSLGFKKHSPEILIGFGVAGTVVAGVMACKATLKVNEITEESKKNIEKINEAAEKGCTAAGQEYSAEDQKKDLTIVYAQTGMKMVKLYAPAVTLGAMSIGAILVSHKVLRGRYLAMSAAYTAVEKSFKEYRGRVVERFGKELDRELRYNIKAKEIEETVVNEDGTETTIKKTAEVVDPKSVLESPYARIFDNGNTGWTKDPESNMFFLKQQEAYANDRLQTKGYLFLNEVYDMLGFPRTKAGQCVGWVYDPEHPNGDNYVDFGIVNVYSEANRRFVNGYERSVVLDFNVDGNILDLI